MQSASYRPDIDGLRAVAIILVLGFHAFPTALPGGFVGVDVFFVISGFLITGIIRNNPRFTLGWFYERRIRRIFPELLIVLLATLSDARSSRRPRCNCRAAQEGWHRAHRRARG